MNMERQRPGDEEEEVAIYGGNEGNQRQKLQLPDELIFTEILPRLPVKSLICFKLVSKQWNSLISSTDFAKTHLQHTVANPNFSADPSSRCVVIRNSSSLRILNYASYDNFGGFNSSYNIIDAELDEFECPNLDGGSPILIGSANGLVCLGVEYDEIGYKFVVYNPCTGDYFAANEPLEDFGSCPDGALFFGFGYVTSSDDYKILMMDIPKKRTLLSSIFVYSLRSDSWQSHNGFDKREMEILSDEGVLVHETLHYAVSGRCGSSRWDWDSSLKKKKCIAAFNLVSEEFNMVPLPWAKFGHDHAYYRGDSSFQLSMMDRCLCAWAKCRDGGVQMWMLKQYGERDSWTKMFNLNIYREWGIRPQEFFGFSPTGKVLVQTDNDDLVLTNVDKCVSKYVILVRQTTSMEAASFVGSLLSPSSMAGSLRED
uniref:F-box domain-containing protein n=1 Tax=Opuntia streptacantha TaxID=393608 RepID=A0A7C9FLF5_OPUST